MPSNHEGREGNEVGRRSWIFCLTLMIAAINGTLACVATSTRAAGTHGPKQVCGVPEGGPASKEQAICLAKAVTLGNGVTPVRIVTYEQPASQLPPYWRVVIVMHDQPPQSGVEAWVAREDGEILRTMCWVTLAASIN